MGTTLDQLPNGTRVAIIRLRSLGDCVLMTPALDILKRSRPDLRLAVVVEEAFVPVFDGNPDVDALLAPTGRHIASWKPRLCLNLHGGPRSALLTFRSGAPLRAGFGHYRYAWVYNVRIPPPQAILGVARKAHTAEHLASAMFYLGAPRVEVPPAKLYAPPRQAMPPYAVIHPVASAQEKTWPAEGFLEVATELKDHWGTEPVFIAGPGEDLSAFRGFRTLAGAPLGEIKRLLSGALFFLGNDSGPAHVAAALQVPSAVIFSTSDPELWGPWRAPSQILVAHGPIGKIRPADVLAALERLRVAA